MCNTAVSLIQATSAWSEESLWREVNSASGSIPHLIKTNGFSSTTPTSFVVRFWTRIRIYLHPLVVKKLVDPVLLGYGFVYNHQSLSFSLFRDLQLAAGA